MVITKWIYETTLVSLDKGTIPKEGDVVEFNNQLCRVYKSNEDLISKILSGKWIIKSIYAKNVLIIQNNFVLWISFYNLRKVQDE